MATTLASSRPHPAVSILMGGIALGTLDLLFACTFWYAHSAVPPTRILQSIAAGLLGRASFDGGIGTAMLGVLCHYFIATMMVWAYYLVSGRWRSLTEFPLRYGSLYGLLLWVVMTKIVVPLSNAPQAAKIYLPWMLSSIAMHAVFGVICALYARHARRQSH